METLPPAEEKTETDPVVMETSPACSKPSDTEQTSNELPFSINNILNNIGENSRSNSGTFPTAGTSQAMYTIPIGLKQLNGECDINVTKQPYVIIQHDPAVKKNMTEMLADHGHSTFETDYNYTGVLWNSDIDISSSPNLADMSGVQFLFMPFTIRKWSRKVDRDSIRTQALAKSVLEEIDWLTCIVEKFKHRSLYGHMNLKRLNIGVRVHCFEGVTMPQATKIKNEFCWVLQYNAIRNKLLWKVFNYSSDAECDIVLVISISRKCFMTGIQIKKYQKALPIMINIDGISLMWPFLQAADSFKVVDYSENKQTQKICLLTFKEHIAGFFHLNVRKPLSEPIEMMDCWIPLKWDKKYLLDIFERRIETTYNKEVTFELLDVQKLLKQLSGVQKRKTTDLTITSQWVS